MKLLSVNVGRPRLIAFHGVTVSSAIAKRPCGGPVMVRALNVDGDRQANLDVHGGEHKAVYAYPFEHYAYWREALGRDDLAHGQFGENFTVQGLLEEDVCIGDRYRVGRAVLEVTQPRVPCRNLAARMKNPEFPKLFLRSQRSGFYLRVIEEGEVSAGQSIERIEVGAEKMSVKEIHTLYFYDQDNIEGIRRALRVPALSNEWRGQLEPLAG